MYQGTIVVTRSPCYCPQPHPLHFAVGKAPPAMAEKGKADHLKERLRPIEGGEDYVFANLEKKPIEFTPIPVSYANFLPYLPNNAMVAIIPTKSPRPPFSQGYNSNATCACHGEALGHSIEHCMTPKHKV